MAKQDTPFAQSDRELIRLIERSPSARAGYKQLVRELGLGGGRERRLLLEQLAPDNAAGRAGEGGRRGSGRCRTARRQKTARPGREPERGAEAPPPQRMTRDRLLAGRLDLHRDGFGFVRPNGATSREDDLFIPPIELNGAMQGDEVLVDEAPPGRDGRRSGRIARVLTRRNPTVVGIFPLCAGAAGARDERRARRRGHNYVTPLDERMTQPVVIPDGPDGGPVLPAPSTQHRVIGEEARTSYVLDQSRHDALEGLAVDVEITEFPSTTRPAQGRIVEVLGHPDDFGVDVEIVIRKHHLPYAFPANVLAEAADCGGRCRLRKMGCGETFAGSRL